MSTHASRRRGGLLAALLSAGAASLAGLAALTATADAPAGTGVLQVEVTPVPLDPGDPSTTQIGPLRFLGGLWLRAEDPRFGGLSDLRVSADGERLVAVSDCGSGLTARLSYDAAGRLAGLAEPRLVALTGHSGGALAADDVDAESLVASPGGGLEVGFEGQGRIEEYGLGFSGPAKPLGAPAGLSDCGSNGGIELMADAGNGKRFLVCEERRSASFAVPAWLGQGRSWEERAYPLHFDGGWAGEPFRPTGAARLPNGDMLVVERRFPPLAARIVLLERAALEGDGPLRPREIARLEPPLTVDNFEGLEVRRDRDGRTLVYLLSDDNNCVKTAAVAGRGVQRTLLLLFVLAGPESL